MIYKDFAPTGFDVAGLGCEDRQDWLVFPCAHNRDSDCLDESNWDVSVKALLEIDPTEVDHEIHRFGHWANGWFEIILVRPGTACAAESEKTEASLANYCILSDSDFDAKVQAAADLAWLNCYDVGDRVEYIREHPKQFNFNDLKDMMGCVRGKYFGGDASSFIDGAGP